MSRTIQIVSADTKKGISSVDVDFQINNKKYQIFFRSADVELSTNSEAFLACAILPCMKTGAKIVADGEVSQRFISALPKIQDLYCSWASSLYKIEIDHALPIIRPRQAETSISAFFTGGVDSLYTFLKNQSEITHLVFVHGFDIPLSNLSLRKEVSKKIRKLASHFGKSVIEVETNLRVLLDPYVGWGPLGHGAALAAIGHLLPAGFSRIFIPASDTYEISPDPASWAIGWGWGTHPMLDHLWSSESLEFIHDGCEAGRFKKVSFICKHDIALQTIRVCWESDVYNCSRCEKCLRTMINLKANKALNRCTTFQTDLNFKHISAIKVDANTREYIEENINALKKEQGNEDLIRVLQKVLDKPQLLLKLKRILKLFLNNLR